MKLIRGDFRSSVTVEPGLSPENAPAVATATDAFVSYARRDRAFVLRLHAALVEHGKDVYVDWEDIPSWSPDYESELIAAIDACDAFLFILSPDSLASPNCKLELDRAVKQGKRIRPLLQRDLGDAAVPDGLRRPQWVDFRRDEAFEQATDTLVKAMGVDSDWVRTHTRIGLRANEWENGRRDSSLLLRGRDLRVAEAWLGNQAGKEPPATSLQTEYLLAARRATTRRQRVAFSAVLVALVVALGLAVFAFAQRRNAIEQRNQATSLALASVARQQLASHPDRALLMSLEAVRARTTPEARGSALAALASAHHDRVAAIFRDQAGLSETVAFSPDGRTLAAGEDDGVHLWDVVTRTHIGTLPGGSTFDVAVSPDGRTIASGEKSGHVRLWDSHTRKQLAVLATRSLVEAVAFSPDGGTLAIAADDGKLRLWDTRTHEAPAVLVARDELYGVAFSADGRILATCGQDEPLRLWNARTLGPLGEIPAYISSVDSVALSPDGSTLASAGDERTVRLWDVRTRKRVGSLITASSLVSRVVFSRDGRRIATAGADGALQLWDTRTRRVLLTLHGHDSYVTGVAFSPDGTTLASTAWDGTVRLWDIRPEPRVPPARGDEVAIEDLAFSPDGGMLATAGQDNIVRLWDARTLAPLGTLRGHTLQVEGVTFSPDGQTVASASTDGTVRLWAARSRTRLATLRPDGLPMTSVAFSADGRTLAAGGTGTVSLWDALTLKPLDTLRTDAEFVDAVLFSPDGHVLAGSADGLRIWNVQTRRQMATSDEATLDLAFSPDGQTIAGAIDSGNTEAKVQLWDARTARPIGTLVGPPSVTQNVFGVAFSPDGRTIAGGGDGVLLWDARTHALLARLPVRAAWVEPVAFSPDGLTLTAGGGDGSVQLWPGLFWRDFGHLRAEVCRLAVGNLTRAQWNELVPGLSYRTTCPG